MMNIFLTGLGENIYPEDQPVISILNALFGALWRGLNSVIVPGFNFSFADVFIALFTAGLVGLILKAIFSTFASHFTNGKLKGSSRSDRNEVDEMKRKGDYTGSISKSGKHYYK